MAARYVVSLADVAALAAVERPAVSAWRRRPSASAGPFPEPVARVRGEDQFDADDIARWLAESGRGNRPDVADELGSYAVPLGVWDTSPAAFDLFTALITLRALSGEPCEDATPAHARRLAAELDPDDICLAAEIGHAGPELAAVMVFADRVVDSAYSPAAALEWVVAHPHRYRTGRPPQPRLARAASTLVATLARTLAPSPGTADRPRWIDASYAGSDLLVALADADRSEDLDERAAVLSAPGNDENAHAAARLAVRRMVARGWTVDVLGPGPLSDDTPATEGPALWLAQCFTTPAPQARALDAVEQIARRVGHQRVGDGHLALVLGPATELVDLLDDPVARGRRAALLRDGVVRAIVRLPRGVVTSAPRQVGALWVLAPPQADRAIRDRWTLVADLAHLGATALSATARSETARSETARSETALEAIDAQALADDVLAALSGDRSTHAHAFTYASVAATSRLVSTSGSLMPHRTGPASRIGAEPSIGVDVAMLAARLAAPLPGLALPGVNTLSSPNEPAPAAPPAATLGDLERAGRLRVLAGHRLDGLPLAPAGATVIGVPELLEPHGSARCVDLLTFAAAYRNGRRTEPGDVVFCASPRPAAVVDRVGGAVVEYPARILRFLDPAGQGLVPALVAADIAALPAASRTWRAWPARTVDPAQVAVVARALEEVERARRTTAARLGDLDRLARLLAAGATGRVVSLDAEPECSDPEHQGA